MTINIADNSPRVSYAVAQGVTQTSFTVSFEFFDDDDLNVYVDGTLKTLTTDYTVTGGDGSTGTVTISVTGASGGSTVVITRDIDLERTTDFPASGAFNIATLNTELDRIIAIAADLDDRAARALQLTDYDAAVGLTLPELDDRKGTVLAFNSSTGAVEAGPTTTNVNQLADITDDIATLADIEDGTDATDAIQTVAGISSNVTTVAGVSANVTTVAGISSNVTTVAGDSADIVTVAGDSADIQALANLTTQIGLLGVSDVISDMNTLATSAIVTDMDALANLTEELDALADITSNITTVAGISSNVTTVAGDSANIGTVASISSNITTVAGISSNVTTVATNNANITTVATNITNVNSFAERYRVDSSDPTTSLDEGDLAFNTTANKVRVYNGTAWQDVAPVATSLTVSQISDYTGAAADLNRTDITTEGLTEASKVVTADSNGVVTFDNGISEEYTAVTSSSNATTVNLRDGTNFSHTLTENTTFTFSNPASSGKVSSFTLKLVQDSSASGYTVTWPSAVDWPAATAPTLTATASAVDYFVFITHDGGTTWYGFTAGQALG